MVEKNARDPQVGHIPDTNRDRDIFLVQNLENPRIWPGSEILGPKMLKITNLSEIIPTHLLRILRVLQHLKTGFHIVFNP